MIIKTRASLINLDLVSRIVEIEPISDCVRGEIIFHFPNDIGFSSYCSDPKALLDFIFLNYGNNEKVLDITSWLEG